MFSRTHSVGLALVLSMAAPATSSAQDAPVPPPSNGASPVAEALFQEGRRLFDAGKVREACPKFSQSQKLEPKTGTLLNLALCHEQDGKTASAWTEFKSATSQAKNAGRSDRERFAREHAEALEAKLSRIQVVYKGDTLGLVVKIDGNAYTMAMLSVAVPVNPGDHEIIAEGPGQKPWRGVITVAPGPVTVPVEIPTLVSELTSKAPKPPAPPTPMPGPNADPDSVNPDEGGGLSPLVYIGFGVAGAGLVLGAVTGGLTLAKSSDLEAACPNDACKSDQQDALDEAETLANVSNVGFVVAGVGAIVGVVGIVLSLGDDGPQEEEAFVTPFITPFGAGLRGQF